MKLRYKDKTALEFRSKCYATYFNKYYNIFMNKYALSKLDEEQNDFVFRKFWADGTIATFKLKNSEGATNHPQGVLVFVPYAPSEYNIYDFATKVTYINKRGVDFIPSGLQEVNKDCVLGWIQKNKKGVFAIVDYYLNKIVDVDCIIKIQLNSHKTPWLIAVSPETENKMDELIRSIQADDPNIYISSDDFDKFKVLQSGNQYIIDKLEAYKQQIINELEEYLGINNIGVGEKKEHLITSEVDANNEIIEYHNSAFYDCLQDFCDRIKEVLNYDIEVIDKQQKETESKEEEDIEDEYE